MVFLTLL